ncbi:MAG: LptF/LptG family permease [Gemmatales bacterium]|nr:LptF/LptG family permease [Gemmatales bacterium]MDW8388449.1 LptF/LptG family permease [Gemmatales bacterium]
MRPWHILHRSILSELLRVFVLALLALTGILVMAGIVAEAARQGLGPEQIVKLVPLLIPGTLPFTIPATMLFAVSVTFGRMSADNELTAIKAAGVPITYALWPALFLGAAISGIVWWLNQEFIPRNHHLLRTTALKDIEELLYSRLRRDLCFNEPRVNYAIWVRDVQGRRLLTATFKKRDANGRDEIIAQAEIAELTVDLEGETVWVEMWQGDMSKDGGATYFSFDKEKVPLPLPPLGAARKVRARELTNQQLLARREELLEKIAALEAGIVSPSASASSHKAPIEDSKSRKEMQLIKPTEQGPKLTPDVELKFLYKELYELDTEYATRPALALGCLFFVLIGCPVAIWFHKRDFLSAFVTCFLPIVIVYYPLMMFGINLGKEGRVNPMYMMWTGNVVLGLVGLILLWRLTRR